MTNSIPGCYGKLPIFGDFLRHHWQGTEVQALDKWFQEGLYTAKQVLGGSWDAIFEKAPPVRFIFRPPGQPRLLIGVSVPGRDQVGRKYPFTVFTSVEAAKLESLTALVPVIYRDFLEAAQDLALKGWIGGDAKQLLAKVDALGAIESRPPESIRTEYEKFLHQEKTSTFWPDLFGSFENPGKYVLLQNLLDALAMIRNAPPGKSTIAVKFPLPASLNPETSGFEVSLWLDAAHRLARRPGMPSLIFWNQKGSSEDPALFLFFTSPSPRVFTAFLQPSYENDTIWDVAKGDPTRGDAVKKRLGPALDDPNVVLGALLTKVTA